MSDLGVGFDTLLTEGMGPNLHWFPEDVSLSSLAATLVGMANTIGGTVLLGITPRSGQIQGLSDPEGAIDRVFQAALLADPPLVLPLPRIHQQEGDQILSVTVPPGLPHVYSLEGRYLGRSGRQDTPLSAKRLRALLMERGVLQFETRVPPDASFQDLDPEQIAAYLALLNLPGGEAQEEILLRRGCLQRVDGELCPTYAGLLLFGRHPQRWLPSATVLAARFPGVSFSDQFVKHDIRGTLPEQLHQAETFVRDNLRSVVRLVGLTHQETPEYPLEAVRELLVNAVAHRDYNQQGDCVHLHVFSDRLEVHSPGRLPGPVNLENLLEARFSRNAVIVQVLSDMGFVERLGYGLNRVVTVMRQNHLRLPSFEEIGGSFRVTLFAATFGTTPAEQMPDLSVYQGLDLNPRQQSALGYLANHRRITNRAYQELCPEVSPETLRRDLADLVRKGVLLKIGDKRATYYIFK
jgi:ATP-dependent DNA helicase RecG